MTWLVVPGYRERAGDTVHGDLRLDARPTRRARARARPRAAAAAPASPTLAADDAWVRALSDQAHAFARSCGRREPLVRVTLADGERFFLATIEAAPGAGFVTLHPHPDRYEEMTADADGAPRTPRAVIVPRQSIAKVELLSRTPRGTRSLIGFRPPRP